MIHWNPVELPNFWGFIATRHLTTLRRYVWRLPPPVFELQKANQDLSLWGHAARHLATTAAAIVGHQRSVTP